MSAARETSVPSAGTDCEETLPHSGPQNHASRLASILVADIVGYSRLMDADEEYTYAALREARGKVIKPGIEASGGRIVKHLGDGFLAEFPSVVAARFEDLGEQQVKSIPTPVRAYHLHWEGEDRSSVESAAVKRETDPNYFDPRFIKLCEDLKMVCADKPAPGSDS